MNYPTRFLILLVAAVITTISSIGCSSTDWRRADRSSVGIAPSPSSEPRAVVQIYAARTVAWRKYFAVHTWISTKEKGADAYHVYHVIGWRKNRGLSVVLMDPDVPDRRWFGHEPELIFDLRGEKAEAAIPKIEAAAKSYPYPNDYRIYPGPNSNTFVAHIIRNVSEIEVELPPHAIGKDWLDDGDLFGRSESGTGVQFSVLGLLGATVGLAEGIEINLLGMSFGLDFWRPALKLPFIGRIGFRDAPIFVKTPTEPTLPPSDAVNTAATKNSSEPMPPEIEPSSIKID